MIKYKEGGDSGNYVLQLSYPGWGTSNIKVS